MDRPSNSDFIVTQLWSPVTLRNHKDGDDTFSETSVRTRATRYTYPEGIYNACVSIVYTPKIFWYREKWYLVGGGESKTVEYRSSGVSINFNREQMKAKIVRKMKNSPLSL
jgi:hypothetical protein